jgi:hypothetical protein
MELTWDHVRNTKILSKAITERSYVVDLGFKNEGN